MRMKRQKTFSTQETIEYQVTAADILLPLRGFIQPGDHVEVVFQVPGGGDYSGMELEVNDHAPVIVRITRNNYMITPMA